MKILKSFLILLFCLFVITAATLYWSWNIEPNLLSVNRYNFQIPHWHKEHNNLKIAVLADLHIGCKGGSLNRLNYIVEQTNRQKPDMILILGDYDSLMINNWVQDKNKLIKILKKLDAPLGVVSILGNHDYYPDIMRNILRKSDITVLEDRVLKITRNGKSFYIAGIKDIWHYPVRLNRINRKIPDKQPAIMLAHNPDAFPEIPEKYGLTLSGHNHAGVISIPFIGGLIIPSKYNQKYVRGHIIENEKQLFVSSGLGTNTYIRFGAIPEIAIIKLSELKNNEKLVNTPAPLFENFNLYNRTMNIIPLIKIKFLKITKYLNKIL